MITKECKVRYCTVDRKVDKSKHTTVMSRLPMYITAFCMKALQDKMLQHPQKSENIGTRLEVSRFLRPSLHFKHKDQEVK